MLSAECEFETSEPKQSKPKSGPFFSKDLRKAYQDHANSDKRWRNAGRPSNPEDPLVKRRKETRGALQKIRKNEVDRNQRKINDELMETHGDNISKVSRQLNKITGSSKQNSPIEYIETCISGKIFW